MKKFLKIAAAMMLLAGSAATLHADLIVCPEDDFFKEHDEECEYVGQLYTAAGDAGVVYVYSSRISNEIVGEIPNGTDIWIDFTYQTKEGVLWGVQTPRRDLSLGQWMNLTEFEIAKTAEDFEREHQDALEPIEQTYTLNEPRGYLTLWEYPGSEHIENYAGMYGWIREGQKLTPMGWKITGIWIRERMPRRSRRPVRLPRSRAFRSIHRGRPTVLWILILRNARSLR